MNNSDYILFSHFVAALKRKGDIETVFDVGVNQGQTSLFFKKNSLMQTTMHLNLVIWLI